MLQYQLFKGCTQQIQSFKRGSNQFIIEFIGVKLHFKKLRNVIQAFPVLLTFISFKAYKHILLLNKGSGHTSSWFVLSVKLNSTATWWTYGHLFIYFPLYHHNHFCHLWFVCGRLCFVFAHAPKDSSTSMLK